MMKKRLVFAAAGLTLAMGMSAFAEEAVSDDAYVYAVIPVPYADFYYGELNDIPAEEPGTATAGQYDAPDAVAEAGSREEGMYDAVTSATTQKSKNFAATYTEDTADGVNILGPVSVNVAISKALYEDAKAAAENGTACSNKLLEFVSAMGEVSETAPAEYKVLNSDGTLSKTVGNTQTAEATASISASSAWGNYGISVEGLDIAADDVQGVILETSDGAKYGLEHEDNLWFQAGEMAVSAAAFTEPHGNEPAYRRFADLPGKTITKITYLLANQDDIAIETELFCKYLTDDSFSLTTEESVGYTPEGTVLSFTLAAPDDTAYAVSQITKNREAVDPQAYTADGTTVTLGADCKPGTYTVTFADEQYADMQASCLVLSALQEGDIALADGVLTVAENAENTTAADYVAAISGVTLNGEPVGGRNLGAVIFTEDCAVNPDAELTAKDGSSTPLFAEAGEYTLEISADGYPSVTGTFVKE